MSYVYFIALALYLLKVSKIAFEWEQEPFQTMAEMIGWLPQAVAQLE